MRRKVVLALCAGAIAAPIPVAALAQTGPDVGDVAAEAVMAKAELRKEARTAKRAAERRVAEKREAKAAAAVPVPPQLYQIAQCESGGDPRAIGGGGLYRGLLQFSMSTWQSVGGTGDPIDASPAEQMRRGAILYARSGPSQWPVCGV
jgi:hypothetical protein